MATIEHCLVCFEALDAYFARRKPLSLDEIRALSTSSSTSTAASALHNPHLGHLDAPSASSSSSSSTLSLADSTPATSSSSLSLPPTSAPLFVTWNELEDDEPSLRGCIGTFKPKPLATGLAEYALTSALEDSRFPPIRQYELPTLQVAVTLLTDFEEVDDAYDWEIGVHGIRLSFNDRSCLYGSTYLPDIASEHGWTKEETLFSLTRKAGWMGSRSKWKYLDLKVIRYQGKKLTLDYSDYKEWKSSIKQMNTE